MNTQQGNVKKSLLVMALAAVFAVSCDKDKDDVQQPGGKVLSKIEENANNYTAFETNAAGFTTKLTTVEDGTPQVITIAYDANNRPKTGTFDGAILKYVYAGNQLDTLYYGETDEAPALYSKLKYQNNQVVTLVNYIDMEEGEDDFPTAKNTYEYIGNDVKTQTSYEWDFLTDAFVISGKDVYEYDTKINPLRNMSLISLTFFQVTSEHNPLKKTVYNENNVVTETITYTYTYDNAGYPIGVDEKSVTPGNPAGTTKHTNFTYK